MQNYVIWKTFQNVGEAHVISAETPEAAVEEYRSEYHEEDYTCNVYLLTEEEAQKVGNNVREAALAARQFVAYTSWVVRETQNEFRAKMEAK